MPIKKNDFIEIDFVGKVKDSGQVFDLTREEDAKKYDVQNPKMKYKPLKICVGQGHLVKGLEDFLIGKDESKSYTVDLPPDQAFGKKDPKLMKIVSASVFKDQKIKPFPGLRVNFDNYQGTVKTVSGGRCVIDFNHPLAGHDVIYEIKGMKVISDINEKIHTMLHGFLGHVEHDFKDGKLVLKVDLPKELQKPITDKLKEVIPEIKDVSYEKPAEKKATTAK